MNSRRFSFIYLFFLLGCIQPFEIPDSSSQMGLLVVEGTIGGDFSRVRISRTANFDSIDFVYEEGAQIFIENQPETTSVQLVEEGNGIYSLTSNLNTSEQYRMRIETGGETYVSDFLDVLETPDIDSVHWTIDEEGLMEFFVTSEEGGENASEYYRWEFEETWHYQSPVVSKFIYKNGVLVERTEEENISNCWISSASSNILIGSTVALGKNLIANEQILSLNANENIKFLKGYSLLVSQYSLTQEAFDFWSILEKNTESLGTLFDPQPSQLPTNMQCISDPSRAVLGFISASSRKQKRILIKPRPIDIPPEIAVFDDRLPSRCSLDTLLITPFNLLREFGSGEKVPLNMGEAEFGDPPPNLIASTTRECADCSLLRGGVKQRPEYWFK